jgi:endonuclease YncB( thermonuclease family)
MKLPKIGSYRGRGKRTKKPHEVLPLILALFGVLLFLVLAQMLSPVPVDPESDPLLSRDSEIDIDSEPEIYRAYVSRVVDGDTIIVQLLDDEYRLRLIGIDAPETVHPQLPVQCYGEEASAYLTELIEEKFVQVEKDVSETDRYGRLLGYIWLGEIMVNEHLVREGYAFAVTFPPDVKYQELLQEAQEDARLNLKGLWSPDTCDGDILR